MHIAVCDDNIADRKQTERLLGRQSDRIFRERGERLYIDSYGNVDAFLQHPQMYHGLFVDMTTGPENGYDIAKILLSVGVTSPIILCVSSVDYRSLYEKDTVKAPNIRFMDKPLKVAEMTAMIEEIKERMGDPVSKMELRSTEGTVYAGGDEIIYVRKKGGAELSIHLEDGRVVDIIENIYNFYDQCAVFPQICPVAETCLINVNHISKTSFGKVTMDNGDTLPVTLTYWNSIKETRKHLAADKENNN